LILDVSQFRDLARIGKTTKPTDIEDLFPVPLYLEYFNRAFPGQFKATPLGEADLAPGDRVVERIERFLQDKKIMTRPSGGFNHYTVASAFASHPPAKLDPDTLKRFEELFAAVNALYT
jgi:hypothetical protein